LGLYLEALKTLKADYLELFIAESTLRDFFVDNIHSDIEEFSCMDINSYIKLRRHLGLKSRTIRGDLKRIAAFFEFCIDELHYNLSNPAALRKRPSVWLRRRGVQPQLDELLYEAPQSREPNESCKPDTLASPVESPGQPSR
jgi:site-specific recombinase XerD